MKASRSEKGFAPIILLIVLLIIGTAGIGYFYIIRSNSKTESATPASTTPAIPKNTPQTNGSREVSVSGAYKYEITIPEGYVFNDENWGPEGRGASIKDKSGVTLLKLFYYPTGWVSPDIEGKFSIDGVDFTLHNNNSLNCSSPIYPKSQKFQPYDITKGQIVYSFEVVPVCGATQQNPNINNPELDRLVQQTVQSIKFSSEFKKVLSGEVTTPVN